MGKQKKDKKLSKKKKAQTNLEKAKRSIKDRKTLTIQRRNLKRKTFHTTTFKRQKTKQDPKQRQYSQKLNNVALKTTRSGKYKIFKYPVATDAVTKKIEDHNTIVFIVDRKATKKQIKKAFNELEEVKVVKVRTLITPKGEKKAFIKLQSDESAMDVATKLNIC